MVVCAIIDYCRRGERWCERLFVCVFEYRFGYDLEMRIDVEIRLQTMVVCVARVQIGVCINN